MRYRDPPSTTPEAVAEYGIHLQPWDDLKNVDGVIVAVAHRTYAEMNLQELLKPLRDQRAGVVIDVKSLLDRAKLSSSLKYWRL